MFRSKGIAVAKIPNTRIQIAYMMGSSYVAPKKEKLVELSNRPYAAWALAVNELPYNAWMIIAAVTPIIRLTINIRMDINKL